MQSQYYPNWHPGRRLERNISDCYQWWDSGTLIFSFISYFCFSGFFTINKDTFQNQKKTPQNPVNIIFVKAPCQKTDMPGCGMVFVREALDVLRLTDWRWIIFLDCGGPRQSLCQWTLLLPACEASSPSTPDSGSLWCWLMGDFL